MPSHNEVTAPDTEPPRRNALRARTVFALIVRGLNQLPFRVDLKGMEQAHASNVLELNLSSTGGHTRHERAARREVR